MYPVCHVVCHVCYLLCVMCHVCHVSCNPPVCSDHPHGHQVGCGWGEGSRVDKQRVALVHLPSSWKRILADQSQIIVVIAAMSQLEYTETL